MASNASAVAGHAETTAALSGANATAADVDNPFRKSLRN